MSKISIDSEGRIHIEDEPGPEPLKETRPQKPDAPATSPNNPSPSNTISDEEARANSSRFLKSFLVIVAVLAVVFCIAYFWSNSGTGSSSSEENPKTTSSTTNNGTQSKPSAQTLTAENRIIGDYSEYDDSSINYEREKATHLMRDIELPFTLNQLATSSPSELAEHLSGLTEEGSSDYFLFNGRGKMQLFKDELTNPDSENMVEPWYFSVDVKNESGDLIEHCSLTKIRDASEIDAIIFWGDIPIENPTYGDICDHVAQVFDYEKIGLCIDKYNSSMVIGSAIADGIAVHVVAFLKPGYFELALFYDPGNYIFEEEVETIEESPFQDNR